MYYNLMDDPEVSSKLKESKQKLQIMGGGMGSVMGMM
jgi:hypothetical protein